ncbi:hypothetical protein CPLU01_07339 [Colletotrichum plurivorum]|uniref:TNT domain-containing protein n=1 Tax=Colletotrichum plurivorum TaxID=2175906 RepID=A0A8H6KFP0_9PEZI|nr:hypothetical protein CPLU01_07339 [Colletotrichum plurivorum]
MRSSAAFTLLTGLSIASALPSLIQVRQDAGVDGYTCTGDLIDADSGEAYACSDDRLGPAVLPGADVQPLGAAVANYKRFGKLTIDEFLDKYWNTSLNARGDETGWKYPPKNGFVLDIDEWPIKSTVKVEVGTYVDRFGPPTGGFVAPAGAGFAQRAIPPDSLLNRFTLNSTNPNNYHVYKVLQGFTVQAGPIAPWFEQPGGGTQYWLGDGWSVQMLLDGKRLEEVPPSEIA